GIGMCTIETCQVIVLPQYFKKKKELANSLRVSGNPLGGAVFPFILVLMFEHYGLRLSFIIMASVLTQLGAFIFLIRPHKVHQRIVLAKRARNHKTDSPENSTAQKPQEKAKKFDIGLFLNPLYWTHLAMITGLSACLPHAQIFVAVYGKSIEFSSTQISALLAYQAILDSITRLIIGFFLNKQVFKKTHCFVAWGVLNFLYPPILGECVSL
ncbi:Major facilitator superfamily, partial [Trinorchestia longiramus]